jgi:hypothetical protein
MSEGIYRKLLTKAEEHPDEITMDDIYELEIYDPVVHKCMMFGRQTNMQRESMLMLCICILASKSALEKKAIIDAYEHKYGAL